jgi:hypothetical protein
MRFRKKGIGASQGLSYRTELSIVSLKFDMRGFIDEIENDFKGGAH